MKGIKRLILIIVLVIVAVKSPILSKAAEVEVGKPKITATINNNKIDIQIGKTDNADGYRIYVKTPGDKKYQVATTLMEDGTKKRQYSYKAKTSGQYVFKVRAFNNKGEKVWGPYSKACKVEATLDYNEFTFGELTMDFPVSWGIADIDDSLLFFGDKNFSFYCSRVDSNGKELELKRAKKLLAKDYGARYSASYDITNSKTVQNEDKLIDYYYVFSTNINIIKYRERYTGRLGMNYERYIIKCKGKVAYIEYNGYYYVLEIITSDLDNKKTYFEEFNTILDSVSIE